jgi:hypothetical protein
LLNTVSLLEPLHPASRIDQFLLTSKERMTRRANFGGNLRFGGTGLKGVAAKALNCNFRIPGMNAFFHIYLLVSGNRPV